MRTLFITHHYLSGNGGGSFASRAFINAFAEISDHMTLMYPVREGEDLFEGINPEIETIPIAYKEPKWKKMCHLLSGKVHRFLKPASEISGKSHFDLVVFDTSVVSFRLIDIFKNAGSKIAVIHHNYQYEYFRDNTSLLLKYPTLFWCRRYEDEAVRKADVNLTLTRQDIKLLSEKYNHGNDSNFRLLGTFEYRQEPAKKWNDTLVSGHRFVITGNLAAIQTKRSLMPWIRNYYPILKEVIPDATLTVAGKDPDYELTEICRQNGINLIPSPISMDTILANADYYICPICLGGGIKLRVMDGLRWGLPVIAHAVSARGYDSFVEKGFVIPYCDELCFAKLLVSLGNSTFDKKDIQMLFFGLFSFDAGVSRLRESLLSVCNS